MDQRFLIYENNRIGINLMLGKKGYAQSYSGFLKAIDELGDIFLHEVYSDISMRFDNADGKGWAKFKNIFNKATEIVGKVGQGANVANSFLNRPEKTEPEPDPTPKKEPWKPNIYLWGGIAAAVIIILLIIYFFKS